MEGGTPAGVPLPRGPVVVRVVWGKDVATRGSTFEAHQIWVGLSTGRTIGFALPGKGRPDLRDKVSIYRLPTKCCILLLLFSL